MSRELIVLICTAASIGLLHTLFGPDHYLPFIVMSRSGKWSLNKTILVTTLCGIGHVFSSVLLGIIGISVGIAVTKLEVLESFRGNLAAWGLITFGLLYLVWGIRRAWRNKPHEHPHPHQDGENHSHLHAHSKTHVHPHVDENTRITPWVLFVIFVFGPCEPLIPLLMYPAATNSSWGVVLVTGTFGVVTIGTMLGIVLISSFGISYIPITRLERYSHALAGLAILLCGLSIQFLGL